MATDYAKTWLGQYTFIITKPCLIFISPPVQMFFLFIVMNLFVFL